MRKILFASAAFALLGVPAFAQSLTGPVSVPQTGGNFTGGVSSPQIFNITDPRYGASPSASAATNTTAIQAAITAAEAVNGVVYIPSAGATGCYNTTGGGLTVTANVSIKGDFIAGNWPGTGQINVPGGSPPLVGSVICPTSNGSDGIDISGTALQVNVENLGISFQTPFTGTGDGIHYVPSQNVQGLSGSDWKSFYVYGHDGNHYAINISNFIYSTFVNTEGFGGGGLNLYGNSTAANFGNSTFIQPFFQDIVGGSSNTYTIAASAAQRLNLLTFIRPQGLVNSLSGVSPGGNLPTSAQAIWSLDSNVQNVGAYCPDMETNVSSAISVGSAAHGNYFDWNCGFTTAAKISAPSWTTNGIMSGAVTQTFNDSSSSGTVSVQAINAMTGTHVTASSATTYTNYPTLYIAPPIAGANVTITSPQAIYATGEIKTTNDVSYANGLFGGGTAQLNTTSFQVGTTLSESKTSPTVTSGLGTSPTVTGGTIAFKIAVGASGSPAAAEVLGMPTASNGWACTASDVTTTANTAKQTATATNSVTLTWSSAPSNSDVLVHQCAAF